MSRRPPAQSQGLSSTAARGLIVLVLAIVLGFIILNSSSFSGDAETIDTGATTTSATTTAPPTAETTTTLPPPPDKTSYRVLVANASGIGGAAGRLTSKLQGLGYQMEQPADATAQSDTTTVYFISGAEGAARAVAADVGANIPVAPMPAQPPVAALGNASVLVNQGKDVASDAPGTTTTSAAAGATTTRSG